MKDSLTKDEIVSILAGKKRTIKIDSIWDYKADYNGRIALFNRVGKMRIAMPHLELFEKERDEFKAALKIIKQIQEHKEKSSE